MGLKLIDPFTRRLLDMYSISIIFLCLLSFAFTHQLSNDDFLTERLHSAALEVISLHSRSFIDEINEELPEQPIEASKEGNESVRAKRSIPSFFNVPLLDNSTDFMHSYVSDTGAGNREDLMIEHIREEPLQVHVPSPIRGWHYIRFNSTDFVMVYQDFHVNVWRKTLIGDIKGQGLHFDYRQAFCSIDLRNEEKIMDAMFYTQSIKYTENLYFAVTIESPKGFQMKAYEVSAGECVPVLQHNLHHNRPVRMASVSSQYRSALVLLFESKQKSTELKYSDVSHDESVRLIEVYVRDATDLETFTINGFGFITVANRFGCEVYRLSEFIEHHFKFETINVGEVIDIQAFRLGFNHFLGLATATNHHYLYVWYSGTFYLKQVFNIGRVLKWNAIYMPTCRDDVLIYFVRNGASGLTFRWSGQRRDFQLTNDNLNEQLSPNYQVMPFSITDFSHNHTAYLFQVDSHRRPHLVSIHTRLDVVPDPELMRGQKISEVMNNLKERFIFQQTYVQKILDGLKYAIRPHSNAFVVAAHLIRNLTTFNGMTAAKIKTLTNIVWQNSRLNGNDLRHRLEDLRIEFNSIEQRIGDIMRMTSEVVLRNKPSVITGHKRFVGHSEVMSLNTSSAVILSVGRQQLHPILNGLYRKRRPQKVFGVKDIVKPISVKDFITSGHVNGIDLKQIVTTNTPQTITGPINFNSQMMVMKDLTIGRTLNNLDVNKDLVFLNRPEVISVPKSFVSPLIVAQKVDSLTIDGIELSKLLPNVMLSTALQTIQSKLIFTQPLTTQSIAVKGMVNDIDLSSMADQLVYRNRPVLIKGKKSFNLDNIIVKNSLTIKNRLDGQLVPNDLLLRRGNQVITAPKYFKSNTKFMGRVTANALVNGLRLPHDIVTLTRNETIFGPIVFSQSIAANHDIDAHRLVDGVDISELRRYSLTLNDKLIQSNVNFNKAVSVGAVELSGDVNEVNLGHLFREAIFKDNPRVEIIGHKVFESPVQMGSLYAERVNGIDINDLVSTQKDDSIYAPKVFAGLTAFNSIETNGLVGGVRVEELYKNRISLTKAETISSPKNFLNDMSVKEWLSVNRINGLVPQIDFVLKSKPQIITGPKIFVGSLTANRLIATNPTVVKGTVGGYNINELNSRVIPLNTHQSLPLSITLMNSNSSFVEVFGPLNGLNVTDFASNVMSVSKHQLVFAPKVLKGEQIFSNIRSSKGINGLSLAALNANAVHLNGRSHISAPFTFTHPVLFNKPIILNGVVNGVNLSYVKADGVDKRGHNTISGHNVFKSGFQVEGDIHTNAFNGVDLSNELLTIRRDHIIRGKVIMMKPLDVNGSIEVNGLVNGLDLSEFSKRVMKTNDRNVINDNLELRGPTRVLTDLIIGGHMNGINLNQLFNDAVFLGSKQKITGLKTLKGTTHFLRHLNATNVNDLNVHQFLNDVVFINSPDIQKVFAPKVFTNEITGHDLIQTKGIAVMTGPVNGVNLRHLDSESIKLNRATHLRHFRRFQNVAVVTNNYTEIFGRINGINLFKDVILLHINSKEPQVITGRKVFEHLVLNDNAMVRGLVNGLPLKAIESNTLFTSIEQIITGHKVAKGMIELSNAFNDIRTLNGLRIPEDFVTLNGNQTIFAQLVFNDPLFVGRNIFVRGSVSGHNLTELAVGSLLKDRPQTVAYPMKFETIIFRRDVMVDQHVDSVDLSALSHTVKEFTSDVNITKRLLLVKAERHHYVSDYLYKSLEKSVFEIDFFNVYQSLDEIHGNRLDVSPDGVITLSETIEKPSVVQLIEFNPKNELFETSLLNRNPLIVEKAFVLNGQTFVLHMSPHSYNFSASIIRSGQLVASIGYYMESIEVLRISPNKVLLVSFQSNTGKVFVFSFEIILNTRHQFLQIAELFVGRDTSKMIAFLGDNQVYIVVAKHYGMSCVTDTTGTLVLTLRNGRSMEVIQQIPVMNIVDVIHFQNNGKHYLALSDGSSHDSPLGSQTVYVYRSEFLRPKCVFSLFQRLQFDNVVQLSAFTYGTVHSKHQYLLAANSTNIMVWKQSGESGFGDRWLLHTKSARAVVPIIAGNKLYLIVGQSYKCHESLIFKAETKGIDLSPLVFRANYS